MNSGNNDILNGTIQTLIDQSIYIVLKISNYKLLDQSKGF